MSHRRNSLARRTLPFPLLCLLAGYSSAGGIDLPTIVASHQGTSNANGAEAADASVLYYNPAGLGLLKGGPQMAQGFSALILNGQVDVEEARGTPTMTGENAVNGRNLAGEAATSGKPGTFWPRVLGAGGAFVSAPVDDMVTAGIGVFAPGGGNFNYKSDWAGAYQIDSVAIELVNINPSIGIRFDDKHSIGLGASVIAGHIRQKVQIDVAGVEPYLLRSAFESGAIGTVSAISPLCSIELLDSLACQNVFQILGPQLGTDDSRGSATVEMYGYGLGYNLGYLFSANDNLRFGLAYRSASTIKLRGTLEWDLDGLVGTPLYDTLKPVLAENKSLPEFLAEKLRPDTTAKGDLIIPARTSANAFYRLNNKIDLMGDFTFIESSAVDKIRIEFLDQKDASGRTIKQGAGGIDTRWKDSFKFSVGGNYHHDDKLTLKSGFQFDKTPIPSAKYRNPGAPDSDRYMFSVGANYKVKKNLGIDAAYSLVLLADAESDYRDFCRVITRDNPDGSYNPDGESCTGNGGSFKGHFHDTSIQVLSVQINQRL